jgi:hypothetical protein
MSLDEKDLQTEGQSETEVKPEVQSQTETQPVEPIKKKKKKAKKNRNLTLWFTTIGIMVGGAISLVFVWMVIKNWAK